jgi:hypothetical protein
MVVDTFVVDTAMQHQAATGSGGSSSTPSAVESSSNNSSSSSSIVSMVSYYTLPSSILGHPEHHELRAAYMYYTGEHSSAGNSSSEL